MKALTLDLRPGLDPERQERTLDQISHWDGVLQAGCLKPDAKHPELRRFCYVYVDDAADTSRLLERLSLLPEVESAGSPAERRLV